MDAKRQLGFSRRAMARLSAEGSQPTISAFGKNFAQVRHAAADAATEIEDGTDRTGQLLRQFDFVTGKKIAAIAVEEIRLGGEDILVLPGILIEIDPRTRNRLR